MIEGDFYRETAPDGEALYSLDERYRYYLRRAINPHLSSRSTVVFVMLNPSTATARTYDPTVKRCANFAIRWGFSDLVVVNLFAFRATNPRLLYDRPDDFDPVGVDNDRVIIEAIREARTPMGSIYGVPVWEVPTVVCAWGEHGEYRGRGAQVARLIRDAGYDLDVLKMNAGGAPGHPLYLPGNTPLRRWKDV